MRILFLAPQVPWPLTNGLNIRMFHLLTNYASRARVHLAAFDNREEEIRLRQALDPYCEAIHLFPGESRAFFYQSPYRWVRRLDKVASLRPHQIATFYSAQMARGLQELDLAQFDVIHVGRLRMVPMFLEAWPSGDKTLTVFDFDDIESEVLRRKLMLTPLSKQKLFGHFDLVRLRAYEAWAIAKFDFTLVCSQVDHDRLRRRGVSERVLVIPNGVDVDRFQPLPASEQEGQILFLGSMSYRPNLDAVRYFATAVFPRIMRQFPKVRLMIAGRDPDPALVSMANGQDIAVTGEIADVRQELAKAAVFVAPLRMGGGTRIKILEAMAMERPVVSTSVGCEGLDVRDGEHLLIADSPEGFAGRCIQLLRDQGLRRRLGRNGRRLVETRYTWTHTILPLNEMIESTRLGGA